MLIQKAIKIATEAHKRQYRNDGITPYIRHPEAVYNLLLKIGIKDEDVLCSAWLHDTIEDCGLTKEFIEKEFNSEIARIVQALTRDISKEEYKKRIHNSDYAVQIIKIADIIHNYPSKNNSGFSKEKAKKKAEDYKEIGLGLSKKICPEFYSILNKLVESFFI